MMTVPVRILTVETVLVRKQYGNSTETVRKHYGNTTETLRNSVSTPYCVVHGYPRKARESDVCMYGGRRDQQGCVTVMQGCVTVMQGCVTVAHCKKFLRKFTVTSLCSNVASRIP